MGMPDAQTVPVMLQVLGDKPAGVPTCQYTTGPRYGPFLFVREKLRSEK